MVGPRTSRSSQEEGGPLGSSQTPVYTVGTTLRKGL